MLFPAWNVTPLSKLYVSPAVCTETVIVPVGVVQVGLVTETTAADGIEGAVLITTVDEGSDVQPDARVTVKLYVPAMRFAIVVVVPVPVMPSGLIVHTPVGGRPLSTMLPVTVAHGEGCVTAPILGVAGDPGGDIMTTSVEGSDIHPAALITSKL